MRITTDLAVAGAGDLAADVSSLALGVLIHLVVTRSREALAPAVEIVHNRLNIPKERQQ